MEPSQWRRINNNNMNNRGIQKVVLSRDRAAPYNKNNKQNVHTNSPSRPLQIKRDKYKSKEIITERIRNNE